MVLGIHLQEFVYRDRSSEFRDRSWFICQKVQLKLNKFCRFPMTSNMQICHPQAWRDSIAIRSFGSRKVLPESVLQLDGETAVVEPFRIEDCFNDDLIFKLVCFTKATSRIVQFNTSKIFLFLGLVVNEFFVLEVRSNVRLGPLGFGRYFFHHAVRSTRSKRFRNIASNKLWKL